jgi:ribosomal protein L22
MLESISESKLKAAILSNAALSKLIYGASPFSCVGANLSFVASLIVGSKINEAEEILKNIKNNPTGDFSERMKAVVDAAFELSMGKTGTKKATLNHKQTILLFDFVSKMKTGPTKNLLTQRLKEL